MTVKRFSACFPGMRREWSIENFESTVSAEVYSISPFLLDKWFFYETQQMECVSLNFTSHK
jgi:hypothetical protein